MFLIMGALTLNALPTALFLGSPPWIARAVLSKMPVLEESASALELSQMITCTPAPDGVAPDTSREVELVSRTPRPRNKSNKLSKSFQFLDKTSSGLEIESKQPNANSELKAALASFLTLRFQLIGLSYGISVYSMITFFVIHVDLAYDRDVLTSQAIYLIHAYSIGDIVTRLLIGVVIDRGYLTADGAMALGLLGSAIACEALEVRSDCSAGSSRDRHLGHSPPQARIESCETELFPVTLIQTQNPRD
ncbi:hypothetical protein HPB47_014488 [Ixodes persulcatus]|uniref:Uncharacterized protein n=1 Tax=Ixodes persulcatus TaxID=34615 RepID=A0AC60QWQ5_IXOPE|nr:hypothetical protein HPB47_014488 [Ixodes persulcatus]